MENNNSGMQTKSQYEPTQYDQTFYECKVILWDLHIIIYNPNSREGGTFCKNAIKPRICDLFIFLNFYVIDKSAKENISKVFTDQCKCIL